MTASKKAREWFAWDGSRFTEPTRKYRIFEAMAPPGGRRDAEIQNPASARLFIKHLLIPDHARLLMDGGRLADMPDLPNTGTSLGRLRKARSAIDLVIKCVEEEELEDDEKRALDQLMERIDALRAAVGVDDADG